MSVTSHLSLLTSCRISRVVTLRQRDGIFFYQKCSATPFFSSPENSAEICSKKDSIVQAKQDWAVIPLRYVPLSLLEEYIPPPPAPNAIELITSAWTEERAQHLRILKIIGQLVFFGSFLLFIVVAYSLSIAGERKARGRDTMPKELKIGAVVYFDISENGAPPQRITIGLLTHVCPIYCEYFHRMCCGLADGESFRGKKVRSTLPGIGVLFGDGPSTRVNVPDFSSLGLPREDFSSVGSWRGAVSSIPISRAKQSGNFCFHMTISSHAPQVFGIIIGGYEVVERISSVGANHGTLPKMDFEIVGCGELCTLDPNKITPIPWDTYSGISTGFNEEKFFIESTQYSGSENLTLV